MSTPDEQAEQDRRQAINEADAGTEFTIGWRNKWLCAEATSMEDFATSLERAAAEIRRLAALGITLRDDDGVADDYATFVTTDKAVAIAEGFGVDEAWHTDDE